MKLEEDLKNARFRSYHGYTSATGVALKSWDDALAFNHFHEGVHTGVTMALKKLV